MTNNLSQTVDTTETETRINLETLSIISRKIRTPMNGVIGMTDLLLATDLSAVQRTYINVITRSADGLLKLLDDIQSYSHASFEAACASGDNVQDKSLTTTILPEKYVNNTSKSEAGKYAGVKVLLAEDDMVNEMVTRQILTRQGCVVTVARNGAEAVAVFKKNIFDLILMDCMMPVMDGYSATGKIIAYEKQIGQAHTPIIAFTANAMPGDDHKCFVAGMDDYISKPIQPDKLIEAMSLWVATALARLEGQAQTARQQRQAIALDPQVLMTLRSLTGEAFISTLESYILMVDRAIPTLKKALEDKDMVLLRRECHSMKSSSQQIGAMEVGELSAEMESLCIEGKIDEVLSLYPVFKQYGQKAVSAIRGYILTL